MFAWISENIATIIVCAVLIAIVAIIIVSMVKNKREGKASCSCGCSNCSLKDSCHPQNSTAKLKK